MAIAIALGFAVLVVLLVIAFVLIGKLNRSFKATQELHQLIAKQEHDRMYAKCSGLYARLFRALDVKGAFFYKRVAFNVMELIFSGVSIYVDVREKLGPFETGQFAAHANGYPTIHSCEEDIKIFATQIRQAVSSLAARRSA